MKQFAKKILVLAVTSTLSLGLMSQSHGATYEVIEVDKDSTGYTYGGTLNIKGEMAVSGTNSFNFPVQFQYLDDNDFNQIQYNALRNHDYYFGLEPIEDFEALKAGNPTANDLTWSKMYLKDLNTSSSNPYFEYQVVADTAALLNLDAGNSSSIDICVFDTDFDSTACSGTLTRSTVTVVQGITDTGITYGTASAPYLPMPEFTDSNGTVRDFWLRDHGQRGFFSPDNGNEIYPVIPKEIRYGGGISAIFDMNDSGAAVGYYSYKLGASREEYVLDTTGGCADPDVLKNIPEEICIQNIQNGMYHIMAFKATLLDTGEVETTDLGLLITPHEDDDRAFSSQALSVNASGVAVGYSHGWDAGEVTTPDSNERVSGSYAVLFKDGKVFDFNQQHYYFGTSSTFPYSRANDINDNGLVVGFTHNIDTGVKKFFYVDSSVPESDMEVIIPKDFFTTSKSTAFGVNSSGVIVGEAEIETHNDSTQNPRRTAGFIYDTSSDSPVMTNVNDLLACNSSYDILKASDINDAGQISAIAIMKAESFDAKGVAIVDDSGNPVMIDVARAVLLNPIAGEVEDCGEVEEKVERQGASFSGFGLLSLMALFGLRRRKANN
ncbi:DUF3466 family protein [Colwellia psychrerythraea]|uniref:GlyGly-CTERM sorting domain-containing protein n=1 Tax=Colwellia psychrerythraea TaxID=28229 RepID=A0A099K859_COLPS|nr:DUF3466 family protein [Colwellia psychrerythraea]KGJ86526.1 Protein of unknown function DUF3466 [Colwellia psychrerythraea]